jgi:DNA-binding transcriptional LysR family regulator
LPKGFLLETRYLKSLIAVVECGSIADSARTEHITAAAIGQRIQALERELGFALLSRDGYTARPTEACVALMPRARRLVREAALLSGDADLDGLSGALRVGAISTALTGMLPGPLRTLTQRAPQARPVIVPGTSRGLFQALQSGDLDAAIVVTPPFALPKTIRCILLRREPLVLLADAKARGSVASLLDHRPYIRYDPDAWGGRFAAKFLADSVLDPTVMCDLDALEAIALLVSDGVGVSLVPRWAGIERFAGDCRVTQVAGTAYEREIVLLTSVDADRPNMLSILAESLQAPSKH